MRVIVVGGGVSGASVSMFLRKIDRKCEIIVYEKTSHTPYSKCALPLILSNKVTDPRSLTVLSRRDFAVRNIMFEVGSEVVDVDVNERILVVKSTSGIMNDKFDKLIIASGSTPVLHPKINYDLNGVFVLNNIDEALKIKKFIEEYKAEKAVIVGSGAVAIETSMALRERGMDVTIVDRGEFLLRSWLDRELSLVLEKGLREMGIKIYHNADVAGVEKLGEHSLKVCLDGGISIHADILISSIGFKPNTMLARKSGLVIGNKGGIVVDEFMRTSNRNIYAIGDCIESVNILSGIREPVMMATAALKQARIAAYHIKGLNILPYNGHVPVGSIKVGENIVLSIGLNTRACIWANLSANSVILRLPHKPRYVSNLKKITVKILYNDITGSLLGFQYIGPFNPTPLIPALTTLLKMKTTVKTLASADWAYSPELSDYWNPLVEACVKALER